MNNLKLAEIAKQEANKKFSYSSMDCQSFVEHCHKKAGVAIKDYRGSNDMIRTMVTELKPIDDKIQAGDIVFMVNHRGGEPARYKKGGAGYVPEFDGWDASHVGIYAGDGQTAESAKSLKVTTLTSLKARPWNFYGKSKYINYGGIDSIKTELIDLIAKTETKLKEWKEALRIE